MLQQAHAQAHQILREAEQQAAALLEAARLDAERRTQIVITRARQIYETAVEDAAKVREDSERQAEELLAAARRQLDLAVELRVELRQDLDRDEAGAPLRLIPGRPSPPSIAS